MVWWYDVPCNIQGFYVSEEHSFSFNPLCEHDRFQEEPFQYKVEGLEQVRSPRFLCVVYIRWTFVLSGLGHYW